MNAAPKAIRTIACVTLALGVLAGCSSGKGQDKDGEGKGEGGTNPNAAVTRPDTVIAREGMFGGLSIANATANKFRLEILSLERASQYTRMRVAVDYRGDSSSGHSIGFAGYRLLDPVGRKVYWSLSNYELSANELWFDKGVRYESDIWFPALPQNVGRVTVLTPGSTGEMPGVPVSNGPVAPPPGAPKAGPTVTGTAEAQAGQTVVYEADRPEPGAKPVVADLYDQIDGEAGMSTTGAGTQTEDLRADVLFAFNSDRLSGKAQGILDRIAREMSQRADTTRPVTIEGHTDGKGTSGYNQDLSERRARAVQAAIAPVLGSVRFQISGKGANEPIVEETKDGRDDPAARARNRRVEISYRLKPGAAGASGTTSGGQAAGASGPPARFRSAPGGVVADRTGTGRSSTGDPVPFRLRVRPFYRDGAFLVAVLEVTNTSGDREAAGFGGGILGGTHVQGFSVTTGGKTYLAVRTPPEEDERQGLYMGSNNMYWEAGKPYRSFVYLTAPPAGTKHVTFNAGPFGKIDNVPVHNG